MGTTRDWRESELALLGTMSDSALAKRLGSVCASGSGAKSGHSNNLCQVGRESPESWGVRAGSGKRGVE